MDFLKQYKSLPANKKNSLSIAVIVTLTVLLILFVWALTNLNFNYNKKAASGEPVDISIGEPVVGLSSAPVTIVAYEDFKCPYCKAFVDNTFSTILANYPTEVRFVFKDYPLTNIHPLATKSAIAAQCAFAQNKFWEMHDLLFANQDTFVESDFRVFAHQLNLNMSQFNDCYNNQNPLSEITGDFEEGQAQGVTGTPTFFVNGRMIAGAQPFSVFKQMIDSELGIVNPSPSPDPSVNVADIQPDAAPDGDVDIFDYNVLLMHFGETGTAGWIKSDIVQTGNSAGKVDIYDYNKLLENFGFKI